MHVYRRARRSSRCNSKTTVHHGCDAQMYDPMLARESTATMTPSLKMKASVVVPCAGFTISITSRSKESTCAVQQ